VYILFIALQKEKTLKLFKESAIYLLMNWTIPFILLCN